MSEFLRKIWSQTWTPYLATYGTFLLIVQTTGILPPQLQPWVLLPQVLVPGVLLVLFLARRSYPELLGLRPSLRNILLDVLVGLAVAAMWMGPYVAGWLSHPPGDSGFQPSTLAGDTFSPVALALRFVGFCLITPFVEELFVRSFLLRYLEGMRSGADFRAVPMARFGWFSFAVTVLYFTFSHVSWEWPAALMTGLVYNGWLYYRGNIGATILAHAVTNTSLFLVVLGCSERGAAGGMNLWFFL